MKYHKVDTGAVAPHLGEPGAGGEQQQTGFVYEPLPDQRCIRVLVLEPAQSADDSIIADLEVLALGESLPALSVSSQSVDLRNPGKDGPAYDAECADQEDQVAYCSTSRLAKEAFTWYHGSLRQAFPGKDTWSWVSILLSLFLTAASESATATLLYSRS